MSDEPHPTWSRSPALEHPWPSDPVLLLRVLWTHLERHRRAQTEALEEHVAGEDREAWVYDSGRLSGLAFAKELVERAGWALTHPHQKDAKAKDD